MDPDPKNWTTTDVESYIKEIGFPDQAHLFKEQLIDGRSLLLLRRVDEQRPIELECQQVMLLEHQDIKASIGKFS